jgi:hypothetical protein
MTKRDSHYSKTSLETLWITPVETRDERWDKKARDVSYVQIQDKVLRNQNSE